MRPVWKVMGVLTLAGLLAAAWHQHNTLARLRAEQLQLRERSREAQRLEQENGSAERLRAENEEAERLRRETRDLHKLRNQVRQLRQGKPELAALQAENRRLKAGPGAAAGRDASDDAGPPIAKELLVDAGLASPEATLQTFFWAIRERNARRLRSCFSQEGAAKILDQSDADVLEDAGRMMDTFKGFQIVAKKVISADEIKLGIRIIQLNAQGETVPMDQAFPFKRVGNDWKIGVGL